ncbi:hypothetical protein ACFWF7_31445 [Nocardia sp. NPDC060256]|uniref:hypothetical protein n=1 Tax=unclassified Nocardia TaxID=2637762 RepID=UPI0036575CFA
MRGDLSEGGGPLREIRSRERDSSTSGTDLGRGRLVDGLFPRPILGTGSLRVDNPLVTKLPQFIDGARVLRAADIRGATPTGRTRHFVGGQLVQYFAGLAIAQYESASEMYLFYCDEAWNCITDTFHDDIAAAIVQAELEFGPVDFVA